MSRSCWRSEARYALGIVIFNLLRGDKLAQSEVWVTSAVQGWEDNSQSPPVARPSESERLARHQASYRQCLVRVFDLEDLENGLNNDSSSYRSKTGKDHPRP